MTIRGESGVSIWFERLNLLAFNNRQVGTFYGPIRKGVVDKFLIKNIRRK